MLQRGPAVVQLPEHDAKRVDVRGLQQQGRVCFSLAGPLYVATCIDNSICDVSSRLYYLDVVTSNCVTWVCTMLSQHFRDNILIRLPLLTAEYRFRFHNTHTTGMIPGIIRLIYARYSNCTICT